MIPWVVAITSALVAAYIAIRKTPAEVDNLASTTADKWQQIADRAAEKALKLDERVTEMEGELRCMREENEDLRDWAERLVHQIRMLGQEPVKIRERKPRPRLKGATS